MIDLLFSSKVSRLTCSLALWLIALSVWSAPIGVDQAGDDPVSRGLAALERGDWTYAERQLRLALDADSPAPLAAYLGLSQLLHNRDAVTEAVAVLDDAETVYRTNAEISVARGRLAFAGGLLDDAVMHFREATVRDPRLLEAWADLGESLLTSGQPVDAAEAFEKLISLNADVPGAHFGLGRARARIGDSSAAWTAYANASRLAPHDPRPLVAMAASSIESGEPKRALEEGIAAAELAPDNASIALTPATVQLSTGDLRGALESAKMVARRLPNSSAPLLVKGLIRERLDETEQAEEAWREGIALGEGDQARLHYLLARLYLRAGHDLNEALTLSERAVELSPDSAIYRNTLELVRERQREQKAR